MNAEQPRQTIDYRRREQASRWFAALQNPDLSPRMLQRWQKWNAVPENRSAFDEVEELWRKVGDLARPRSPAAAQLAADHYDGCTAVSAWLAAEAVPPEQYRRRRSARTHLFGLAASIAIVVPVLWMIGAAQWQSMRLAPPMIVIETSVGEHEEVALKDGSKIQLGAKTAVTTNVTQYTRTVVLDRGEALFHIAHDPKRPFKVMAGGGTITALGTAFNVRRRDDDQVVVTVTEGTVEIAPNHVVTTADSDGEWSSSHSEWSPAAQRLTRGQEISYDARGRFSAVRLADSTVSVAWRDGRLKYRSEPLKNVIPDVNRYSRRSIILEDRAAGELMYSGTVFERDVDDWIAGLEKIFPVEVIETDTHHVLVRIRPQATP